MPDGRGEDNKEKANGEDLRQQKQSAPEQGSTQITRGTTYKGKTNNGLETCRHDCGVVVVVRKGITVCENKAEEDSTSDDKKRGTGKGSETRLQQDGQKKS